MNPMADAIRKKRVGSVSAEAPEGHMEHEEGGKDLLGLVASLSPEDRGKLKNILHASGVDDMAIQKGEPSMEEHSKIGEQISEDEAKEPAEETGQEMSDEGVSPDESDEIGRSMLDSKYRQGPIDAKPRGLGDRVKNAIATKLKGKGKL